MTTVALAEAHAQLSELVDDAARTHEGVEVTSYGRRAAVIMGADDYDSLMETLDILAMPRLWPRSVGPMWTSPRARTSTLGEVEAEMRTLGRLPG